MDNVHSKDEAGEVAAALRVLLLFWESATEARDGCSRVGSISIGRGDREVGSRSVGILNVRFKYSALKISDVNC
jgi:hypothetical protein